MEVRTESFPIGAMKSGTKKLIPLVPNGQK